MAEQGIDIQEQNENEAIEFINELVFTASTGNVSLALKIEVITKCETCQGPLAQPVIVMFNDTEKRTAAIVGEECQD